MSQPLPYRIGELVQINGVMGVWDGQRISFHGEVSVDAESLKGMGFNIDAFLYSVDDPRHPIHQRFPVKP